MRRLLLGLVVLFTLVPAGSAVAASGDDRIVLVGDVLVDRDETAGDVVVADGDVVIRGTVDGDVIVADGDVTIRGTVDGDVVTFAGTATLGRRAQVRGDLHYLDNKPVVTPGARVEGKTKRFSGELKGVGAGVAIGFWIAVSLSLLVLGLLLLLLAPRAGDAIARTARAKLGVSILIGVLAIILLPIIAVLACVSIIGLPLGIVLLLALVPLFAISYVTTAFVIGNRIVKGSRIPAFLVGLLILRVLALIPIAGGLIGLLATIIGLGVLLKTLLRARA
jgi:cytoskeletal protein CcmA (bactofilin family)